MFYCADKVNNDTQKKNINYDFSEIRILIAGIWKQILLKCRLYILLYIRDISCQLYCTLCVPKSCKKHCRFFIPRRET